MVIARRITKKQGNHQKQKLPAVMSKELKAL